MHYHFFLIVPPGLESSCLQELKVKFPLLKDYTLVTGGIEVKETLEWSVRAHYVLKTPTRILLRLEQFKVKDYPKLYQKFLTFKWHQYLSSPKPQFHITAQSSRVFHTKKIDQTIHSALMNNLKHQPLKKRFLGESKNQNFYIRLEENLLTLSLDLSGEPLYKREWQKIKGVAPLRENIAAALLIELTDTFSMTSKEKITLLDPMCGSGTFLTEGFLFNTPLKLRSFAFEHCPFFGHIPFSKIYQQMCNSPLSQIAFSHYVGFDIEKKLLEKVRSEISKNLPLTQEPDDHPLFSLEVRDTLKDSLRGECESQEIFLICNPPYGERIKIKRQRGTYLKEALNTYLQVRPQRIGWLVPSDMESLFPTPDGYQEIKKIRFKNGGLHVSFWVWERSLQIS